MHHIRKLTMLKGNTEVEKILLKRRRKTIAVCQCCNAKIQKVNYSLMLIMESRIHGDMYVRFGGRYGETYRRKAARRPVPSLQFCKYATVGDSYEHHSKILKTAAATANVLNSLPMITRDGQTALSEAVMPPVEDMQPVCKRLSRSMDYRSMTNK